MQDDPMREAKLCVWNLVGKLRNIKVLKARWPFTEVWMYLKNLVDYLNAFETGDYVGYLKFHTSKLF